MPIDLNVFLKALAGNATASADESCSLIEQLQGRARFLRRKGRIKDPQLMEEAAALLRQAIKQESSNA